MPLPILGMELARDRLAGAELGRATLRAQVYAPDEAVRAGYLDEVVGAADVVTRAKEEATKLGALSRMAYHATKTRLRGKTIAHIVATLDDDMKAISAGR
jgi:enoyl-CoA hydratase